MYFLHWVAFKSNSTFFFFNMAFKELLLFHMPNFEMLINLYLFILKVSTAFLLFWEVIFLFKIISTSIMMMMLMVIMMMVTASLGMREPMTSGASCFRDYRKCLWTRLPLTPPPQSVGTDLGMYAIWMLLICPYVISITHLKYESPDPSPGAPPLGL